MKCLTCVAEGRRSTVGGGLSSTTLMGWRPYYDDDGRYHSHNPNVTMTTYRCSNGHEWSETAPPTPCPTCSKDKKETKSA